MRQTGMSTLTDSLRPFWPSGLNEISGNVTKGIGSWLAEQHYQIFLPVKTKRFTLQVSDSQLLLAAIAADINRTTVAAYESIGQATKNALFPRATAWMVIKSYYAAFFSAHAVLRMLGTGFVNVEQSQAESVNEIARLFSLSEEDIKSGSYTYTLSSGSQDIHWTRVDSSSGGVHEKFWTFFRERMDNLSKELLKSKSGTTIDNQRVSARLNDLVENLCHESCHKGNWLSVIRNRVNYKHQFGAWYPYRGQLPSGAVEERLVRNWLKDPMTINLTSHRDWDLRRFQETCSFIIGCCRALASDMALRCSSGKSFHTYGWLAISRFAEQRTGIGHSSG